MTVNMAHVLETKLAKNDGWKPMGTITKALELLNYFSESRPEIGLLDFKRLVGRDKATVHRHLTELEENGFLEQNVRTRKYRLGAAVLRLSSVREKTFPARRIISQWVDRLSNEFDELVHASLIQKRAMSPIHFQDSGKSGVRVFFNEAEILPMHATSSGLAALAFGSPALLEKALSSKLDAFTSFTITDKDALKQLVQQTRIDGFAYADQTYEEAVCSLAVPFFDENSTAYGTIAIALPTSRMEKVGKPQLVEALWRTSSAITTEIGGKVPDTIKDVSRITAQPSDRQAQS